MGNLFTARVGNILTVFMGNVLTAGVGKVLDIYISQKEAQIQRLERLVLDAIYALQKAGLDDEANRLRRALQKI